MLEMNWRFLSRSPAVLMSAVIILRSTFYRFVFTRGSVIRTMKKGMLIVVTRIVTSIDISINITRVFLETLIKERS